MTSSDVGFPPVVRNNYAHWATFSRHFARQVLHPLRDDGTLWKIPGARVYGQETPTPKLVETGYQRV